MTRDRTPPAAASESDHALYLRWLERQRERQAQKTEEERARDAQITHDMAAKVAVIVGRAANDGTGHCRWCRIVLGSDGKGNRTHPDVRECSGPAPEPCGICRQAWRWDATTCRWDHACRGRQVTAPAARQVERIQTPGAELGGMFGYRRGEE